MTNRQSEALRHLAALRGETNDSFWPLFFDEHRFLVLKGGGGSGKSIFAGRKIIERCLTEPGHRFLVVRKVARTLRASCFEQLRGQVLSVCPDAIEHLPRGSGDMMIRFRNGSCILFSGLDDVEKLKSIYDVTGIWIEEASEVEEADFNQLDIRLRTNTPYYLQFILSFNPISITHWLKRRFFDAADDRVRVHESTYLDNRFLSADAIRVLEGFRETDDYFYRVYCLGEWGVTGRTVFDGEAVTKRLLACRDASPLRIGQFVFDRDEGGVRISGERFAEDGAGAIRIYREPQAGVPYVIGCDTAGDGSDFFVAQVLDNSTGEQVAVLRQETDEDAFTRQVYCLGRFYHDALIGIEANFSSYPIKLLGLMGYRNQFVRETEDRFTGNVQKAYGFRTSPLTRPVILGDLVRIMRDGVRLLHDCSTLEEMLTFVRNEKQRAEAEAGAHDDCVMALAIAYYIRTQQRTTVLAEGAEPQHKWTADMREDWRRAGKDQREYLRKKWGDPA